jgi:hypothetical protein
MQDANRNLSRDASKIFNTRIYYKETQIEAGKPRATGGIARAKCESLVISRVNWSPHFLHGAIAGDL